MSLEDLATIHPARPDRFADGSIHEVMRRLRTEAPGVTAMSPRFFWKYSVSPPSRCLSGQQRANAALFLWLAFVKKRG